MDLNLFSVMRRHPIITASGIVAGLLLAAVMTFGLDSKGQIRAKSYTNYELEMQVIVVDPQYQIARGNVQTSDPLLRTVMLAKTYANLLTSDRVRSMAMAKVGPTAAAIQSQAVDEAPIVTLTLQGRDRLQLERYGVALGQSLQEYLLQQQVAQGIEPADRMSVRILSTPRVSSVQSQLWQVSLMTFLAPVMLAYALAVLRERSIARRQTPPPARQSQVA